VFGMAAHDCPFFLGERTGFEEDVVGYAELANIMEQRAS